MPEACGQHADARGGDPTVDSLDLSRPRLKKFKAEHWPRQIAATPNTAHPPRIADARGGVPTVESLDLSRPRPKKFKAEHWPDHIAAAWGRVGDARRAAPAVSRWHPNADIHLKNKIQESSLKDAITKVKN